MSSQSIALNEGKHDPEQVKLMAEECILVDENDVARGKGTKVFCHLWTNIEKGVALHRAFSVCLFNSAGQLLLQQRSAAKITFPLMWTNTCCSHPLAIEGETEEAEHIGVKRAAIRKLEHELGIVKGSIDVSDIHYLTRILYHHKSGNTVWGEHEVDHILFIQKDVPHTNNPNEVAAAKYVSPEDLQKIFSEKDSPITPWFQIICNEFLFPWWAKLPQIIKDHGLGAEQARAVHRLAVRDESKGYTLPSASTIAVATELAAQEGSGMICSFPGATSATLSSVACSSSSCASICHTLNTSSSTSKSTESSSVTVA